MEFVITIIISLFLTFKYLQYILKKFKEFCKQDWEKFSGECTVYWTINSDNCTNYSSNYYTNI